MSEPALPPVNVKAIARVALGFVALATVGILALTFGPFRDRNVPPSTQVSATGAPDAPGGDRPAGQGAATGAPQVAASRQSAEKPADGNQSQANPAQANSAHANPGQVVPGFDVVRIEPNGEAVIAGRAAPNVAIELLLDDGKGGPPQVLQRAVTDSAGLFAFTNGPMQPGSHVLSLRARQDVADWTRSSQVVNVTINPPAPPLVALVAPDRPAVLLSSPDQKPGATGAGIASAGGGPASGAAGAETTGQGSGTAAPAAGVAVSGARVAQVETDNGGRLFVVGKARPGSTLRLYLNDALLASGVAKPDGVVEFAMDSTLPKGAYRVRLDEVDPATGKVLSRAEAPWDNKPEGGSATAGGRGGDQPGGHASGPASGLVGPDAVHRQQKPSDGAVRFGPVRTHVVSRGDSLWSISRQTYQLGSRYTTIYDANQNQIADRDRIYPGQVFVLPQGDRGQTSEK